MVDKNDEFEVDGGIDPQKVGGCQCPCRNLDASALKVTGSGTISRETLAALHCNVQAIPVRALSHSRLTVDPGRVEFGVIGGHLWQAVRARDLTAAHVGRYAVVTIGDEYRCSGVIVEIVHREGGVEVTQRKRGGHEWTACIGDLDLLIDLRS